MRDPGSQLETTPHGVSAEQALQDAQAVLTGVLDGALDGIGYYQAVRDPAGLVVDFEIKLMNAAAARMANVRPEEALGRRVLELFPGLTETGLFEVFQRVERTGITEDHELYYGHDGISMWTQVRVVKVLAGVTVTSSDVTAARLQRRFAETLLDRLPAGVTYIDKDMVYRVVNPALARFYGRPLESILGRRVFEVLEGAEGDIQGFFDQVRTTLEPLELTAVPASFLVEGQRKTTYWDASLQPYLDEHGDFAGWLILAFEVSQRVAQAEALAERRQFAEHILANVPSGVAYLDRDLYFRFGNATYCKFLNQTPETLTGMYLDDAAPGAVEQTGPWLREVMATGKPFGLSNFTLVIHEPDGTTRDTFWDFIYLADEPDADGHAKGVFVLANEISDRLHAERERDEAQQERIRALEEANTHKEQFLSILSHELRTPINAIMGFASVLDDEVMGELTAPQHAYLGKILDGSDRMLALIEDLLDMSRIQAGKFSVTFDEVDLAAVCQEALAALQPLASQKDLILCYEGPITLPGVRADSQRLEQVVTNLLSNALKFTPPQGQVTLRTYLDGERVRVEVTDTGIGIAPADQQRVFDAFTQVDMSNTRQVGGTGLGLAISRSLIEAHGGTIGVTSEPGRGSTFWFELRCST